MRWHQFVSALAFQSRNLDLGVFAMVQCTNSQTCLLSDRAMRHTDCREDSASSAFDFVMPLLLAVMVVPILPPSEFLLHLAGIYTLHLSP